MKAKTLAYMRAPHIFRSKKQEEAHSNILHHTDEKDGEGFKKKNKKNKNKAHPHTESCLNTNGSNVPNTCITSHGHWGS